MTLVLGMRCSDGVVLVADRKISNTDRPATKIRRLPTFDLIIFTAGGIETIIDDFLTEVDRNSSWTYNAIENQNKDQPEELHRQFTVIDFKNTTIDTLKRMRETYSIVGENYSFSQALQVMFVVPENMDGKSRARLYRMDMDDCLPVAIEEGKVANIGNHLLGKAFLQSLEKRNPSMEDAARVFSFVIKYIEKEDLDENQGIGVGKLQPQIFFVLDGKSPLEIEGEDLTRMLDGVDNEVEKMKKTIGSQSTFLRF